MKISELMDLMLRSGNSAALCLVNRSSNYILSSDGRQVKPGMFIIIRPSQFSEYRERIGDLEVSSLTSENDNITATVE